MIYLARKIKYYESWHFLCSSLSFPSLLMQQGTTVCPKAVFSFGIYCVCVFLDNSVWYCFASFYLFRNGIQLDVFICTLLFLLNIVFMRITMNNSCYVYSWPLNNRGLNCIGLLICGLFFSVGLCSSVDPCSSNLSCSKINFSVANPCMWRSDYYTWFLTTQEVDAPNPHVGQGSTVFLVYSQFCCCTCIVFYFVGVP